jgi:hypothetical protein
VRRQETNGSLSLSIFLSCTKQLDLCLLLKGMCRYWACFVHALSLLFSLSPSQSPRASSFFRRNGRSSYSKFEIFEISTYHSPPGRRPMTGRKYDYVLYRRVLNYGRLRAVSNTLSDESDVSIVVASAPGINVVKRKLYFRTTITWKTVMDLCTSCA